MGGGKTVCGLVSVLVIFLAVWFRHSPSNPGFQLDLDQVIQSLLKYEANHGLQNVPRVAVGYGACRDLFVPASHLLQNHSFPATPNHYLQVSSETELLEMFAYFFQHGAAAERFVSDAALFSQLVRVATQHEEHRWALGGNAPVMAARFAREGAQVLLGAKLSPSLTEWVPQGVKVAGGVIEEDDIHLIMEYKREETWDSVPSPRANRFIIHHDLNNPLVSSLEDFAAGVSLFNPNLLVVSGLQMMDNFPFREGERQERLERIREGMVAQGKETRVHFEMASFVDNSLMDDLAEKIIPYADSLGMNEQELPNLHSLLTTGTVSLVADSNPRIATVLDQMREVYKILSVPSDGERRPVTRIHLHTLAYQAILTKKGEWRNNGPAAVKASLTAHRHVCASQDIKPEKSFLIMDDSFATSRTGGRRIPFNNGRPLTCWDEDDLGISICIAPVLVCAEAVQTAGGGDNISAAGLVMQI